jgi:hypothetical protein
MRILILLGVFHPFIGCAGNSNGLQANQGAQATEAQSVLSLKIVDWVGPRSPEYAEAKFRFTNRGNQTVYMLTTGAIPVTDWERLEANRWTGDNAVELLDGMNMSLGRNGVEFGHEVRPGESFEFEKTVYKSLFNGVKQVRICAYLCDNSNGDCSGDGTPVFGAGFSWDGD